MTPVWRERRRRLWQTVPERALDAILVTQRVNRRYLTGFTGSSGVVVLTPPDRSLVLTDSRYWEQAAQQAEGSEVMPQGRAWWQQVETLVGSGARVGFEADAVTWAEWHLWCEDTTLEWVPLQRLTEALRIRKSPQELQAIERACAIVDQALERIWPLVRPGITETVLAQRLMVALLELEAEGLAFDPIVVSGERGALPHGRPTARPVQAGELVTIDVGAQVDGYHSDETVTWRVPGAGAPSGEQKKIYDIVVLAQQEALRAVRPGVTFAEVDRAARAVIEDAGYGQYFGHGVGHGVGLEVHEAPWARQTNPYLLDAAMVLTVEPGVYIPGWGGVRVEDTVEVTAQGVRRLTHIDKARLR
jgi:Xaa-Pro aminopeptidase